MSPISRSPAALAFGGLLALAAAMGIGRFVYTPILPFMTDGLQLPPDDAGLIASANFLGYLAGALAGASRSLPGNPRLWFLGGLLASALKTSGEPTRTGILNGLLQIRQFDGVTGKISYPDGSRIPLKSVSLIEVAGGGLRLAQEILPKAVPAP